ncbi:MAG: hypothetical protein KBC36_09690 [Spirochaetia bacterium]|nr:hypothetical protein [Spirochaetia bacterium]HOX18456.1 hypothetical protein [Spirochaetales bacterium]
MDGASLVPLVTRLATTALAAFLAIALWSRTRDIAWMLVVIGTVAGYADILYSLLLRFGVVDERTGTLLGVPLAETLFANLPALFYAAAFLTMLRRRRPR